MQCTVNTVVKKSFYDGRRTQDQGLCMCTQSAYRGRGEIGGVYLPSQLERILQLCSRWWKGVDVHPPPPPSPAWADFTQKVAIATLCTLWLCTLPLCVLCGLCTWIRMRGSVSESSHYTLWWCGGGEGWRVSISWIIQNFPCKLFVRGRPKIYHIYCIDTYIRYLIPDKQCIHINTVLCCIR